jgi:hypothetical protein
MAQVGEHLLCKLKALSSNPRKKKKSPVYVHCVPMYSHTQEQHLPLDFESQAFLHIPTLYPVRLRAPLGGS